MAAETFSTSTRNAHFKRRGGALAYTAIVILVLIGFVGLAIDWGYMTWTAQKLQNAADAAALAGAQQVWWSHSDARAAAIDLASRNEAGGAAVTLDSNLTNDPNGDVVIGIYDRVNKTFTASTDTQRANAVRVAARRTTGSVDGPLPLIFGPIFDKDTAEVERFGIAVAIGGPARDSVIALNEKEKNSFYLYGNAHLDLGEGSAQVNSTHPSGAVFQGNDMTFLAGEVNMVSSDYTDRGNPDLNSIDMNTSEPTVLDPLAGLPEPTPGAPMNPTQINPATEAWTYYEPGYYPNGLDLQAGDNVYLNPGIYILENGDPTNPSKPAFAINGHANLTGYGVMFFIKFGSLLHNGTGEVRITPMNEEQSIAASEAFLDPGIPDYAGIQFFQARDNTQMATFNGTSLFTGTDASIDGGAGTFYFPEAKVEFGGTGDMYIDSIIADQIHVYGSGKVTVTRGYDGRQGGDEVYLVE